jgi:hypothetical protein
MASSCGERPHLQHCNVDLFLRRLDAIRRGRKSGRRRSGRPRGSCDRRSLLHHISLVLSAVCPVVVEVDLLHAALHQLVVRFAAPFGGGRNLQTSGGDTGSGSGGSSGCAGMLRCHRGSCRCGNALACRFALLRLLLSLRLVCRRILIVRALSQCCARFEFDRDTALCMHQCHRVGQERHLRTVNGRLGLESERQSDDRTTRSQQREGRNCPNPNRCDLRSAVAVFLLI